MTDWATIERWSALRDGVMGDSLCRELIMDGDRYTGCSFGVDGSANLHLMVQVSDEEGSLPPDLNGITIRYSDSDTLVVAVSSDASLESIISPVYNAIIQSCLDGRHPVAAITDHLERIRKAFTRAGSEISENKQIGLVGELLVMKLIVIPALGRRAVSLWTGPLSERHDFVGATMHLEVKSTTKSQDQHTISRLDQLRIQDGKCLLLASVQLERTVAGEMTIATLRDEIVGALGNDGPALRDFDTKLNSMGWNDRLVQSGTLLRFNMRSLSVFSVDGSFPRLPDDYRPPRGVVGITYDINASACSAMDPIDVINLVSKM